MILTIDGPAGAGKSSVTRMLAERIGFQFLDTGAMYRAVTWAAMQANADLNDEAAILAVARQTNVELHDDRVLVAGDDVSEAIRQPEVTVNVSAIADNVAVRKLLVQHQRKIAEGGNFVCEGRDQGTIAFQDAFCKIFLTASATERAKRRLQQLQESGSFVDYDQVIREQELRDQQDESRPFGRLLKAEDAIEVNTDYKSLDEVVDELESIARSKMAEACTEQASHDDRC